MAPKARHVVEGQNCGERALLLDQFFGEFLAGLEARNRIARFGQIHDQPGIEFEAACLGAVADASPARRTVGQRLGAADEGDLAMTERVQMFERQVAADFVVDDDRTHRVAFEFAADHGGGNAAFFQIGQAG